MSLDQGTEKNVVITNLAPRKRAKTQEEKEQRRIERILRNRRAAHASREKKRRHVEFLENHVLELQKSLKVFKERDSKLMSIEAKLIDYVTDASLKAELQNEISLLPKIPDTRFDTLELMQGKKKSMSGFNENTNKRNKNLGAEDNNVDVDVDVDVDGDGDADADGDGQMMMMSDEEEEEENEKINIKNKKNKEQVSLQVPKVEARQSNLYLSPPASNLGSTSPSNLTLELNPKMVDDYLANPLFADDLNLNEDNDNNGLFSTNLQIKHEFSNEDLTTLLSPMDNNGNLLLNLVQAGNNNEVGEPDLKMEPTEKTIDEFFGDADKGRNNNSTGKNMNDSSMASGSGFKMMHHPAVMMFIKNIFMMKVMAG
ncbi:hypothetical protein PACTADRAFT_47947 [Pachysolen tannophilus NRRL Y-2460]|uniref:BZIP domain-containing protein n=1 Tax=Pachysolen tannophilus NRRL Y-2460 TaxID=669874 RepID=A0A1E4U298_PACTA|nr:hypothetical protein PACTADRAFT_47947 [Pachysolen tannophilus NRRL Y-2460]